MAENTQENILNDFNDFDRIPCPTIDVASLENESTSKTPSQKVIACKRILKRVEQMVNTSLAKMGVKSRVNLSETFSCGNERLFKTTTSFSKEVGKTNNLNIQLNINLNKLKYPAFEFSAMISTVVYKTVYANIPQEKRNKIQDNLKASEEQTSEPKLGNASMQDSERSQFDVAKWFLTEYLKDFLKQSFPEEFKDAKSGSLSLDLVAELISNELLGRMSAKEIQNLPQDLFSFKKYDNRILNESKRFIPSENLYQMRTEKLREKATQFAADPNADYTNAQALSNEQQFVALAETFAGKMQGVSDALKGGFSNSNEALRNFCQDYAKSFMASNNLADIEINFVDSGNCKYVDKGEKHHININLNAISNGSVSELLMTLSHELTHAVDSSINKIQGNYNEHGGGLLNSMSEDISGCDIEEAKPLLTEVQRYCYQLNPNERHGRIGELSAVRFMKQLYAEEPNMQAQMDKSMEAFKAYQEKTISYAEKLPSKLSEFESKLSTLNIPTSSKAYKMIRKRIDYLREIGKTIDCSAEQESIRDLLKIAGSEAGKTTSVMAAAQEME